MTRTSTCKWCGDLFAAVVMSGPKRTYCSNQCAEARHYFAQRGSEDGRSYKTQWMQDHRTKLRAAATEAAE